MSSHEVPQSNLIPDSNPGHRSFCESLKFCQLRSAIETLFDPVNMALTEDEKRRQLDVLKGNTGFKKCPFYNTFFQNPKVVRLQVTEG